MFHSNDKESICVSFFDKILYIKATTSSANELKMFFDYHIDLLNVL